MNDDYLWDKSGKPDAETARLEELLGAYRYQPQSLDLPDKTSAPSGKGNAWMGYFAIAAAIVLTIGAGIWIGIRQPAPERQIASVAHPAAVSRETPGQHPDAAPAATNESTSTSEETVVPAERRQESHIEGSRAAATAARQATTERQGRIAREKVLYAFQITTSKLSLIDKKIQTELN